ncbi:MAG: 16S rRNA (uracil(1498)-N(3))-methyltransferase [Cellvibrionales bacterium]|nr:16S rRNA (uracil(1498)-N(3))-methyltransferase [Cellvibrionales bacterium]
MNLILFAAHELTDNNSVLFDDYRHVHIQNVLKSQVGNVIRVGEINGQMGEAHILSQTKEQTLCQVNLYIKPPEPLSLSVVMALPRPKVFRRCIKMLTELGVKDIHIIHCYKVEKSYWQSPLLADAKIHQTFIDGLTQVKDTLLPRIHFHKRFKPFTEDILPLLIEGKTAFIGHPYLDTHLSKPSTNSAKTLIIIGPEGGFIDYELDLIAQQGVFPISLGDRIYSVETALSLFCSRFLHA